MPTKIKPLLYLFTLLDSMKDMFMWMNDNWAPAYLSSRWYYGFMGRSKTFKKNKRKGL